MKHNYTSWATQLSAAVKKLPENNNLKEGRLIWARNYRDFSPYRAGTIVFRLVKSQVHHGGRVRQRTPAHLITARKQRGEEERREKGLTTKCTPQSYLSYQAPPFHIWLSYEVGIFMIWSLTKAPLCTQEVLRVILDPNHTPCVVSFLS